MTCKLSGKNVNYHIFVKLLRYNVKLSPYNVYCEPCFVSPRMAAIRLHINNCFEVYLG